MKKEILSPERIADRKEFNLQMDRMQAESAHLRLELLRLNGVISDMLKRDDALNEPFSGWTK